MSTPTLAERLAGWLSNRIAGEQRRANDWREKAEALARENADLLERCRVLAASQLRHESVAALEAENTRLAAERTAAEVALDSQRGVVAALKRSRTIADEHLLADTERLRRIGALLPLVLDTLPWGAYKGALMEDGDIKAAIEMAKGKP